MDKNQLNAKVAETRTEGCFEATIPQDGFRLDLFLRFVDEMFPGIPHSELHILKAEEGNICIWSERPVVQN